MYLRVLTAEFEGSNSETKFFIVKLLQEYRGLRDVNVNLEDLSKELGVTVRTATKSMEYLVSKGYLKVQRYSDNKGGFPNGYQFQNSLTEHLIKAPLIPTPENIKHKSLIDDLLIPDVNIDKDEKRHSLHTANRLLLSVLLIYADECGAVRCLGVSDISKLTGMSKDRFRSQLEKLKDLGYIRSHISGVTGARLFGVVNGAYFLNLRHPKFKNNAKAGVTIICANEDLIEATESNQVFCYAKTAKYHTYPSLGKDKQPPQVRITSLTANHEYLVPYGSEFAEIANFFMYGRGAGVEVFLQMKFEEYASFLLSTYLKDLPEAGDFEREDLISKIKAEMLPKKLSNPNFEGDSPTEEQKAQLFSFIYKISLALAQSIKCFLKSTSLSYDFEAMNHTILPSPLSSRHRSAISIESFYKKHNTAQPRCFIFSLKKKLTEDGDADIKENDIPSDEKYRYGLLTRPSTKSESKTKEETWPDSKSKKHAR